MRCLLELTGIIVVSGNSAFQSVKEVDDHFREFGRLLTKQRDANGYALVLLDLPGMTLQSQEIADRMKDKIAQVFRPEDRVAAVLRSVLLKMQIVRIGSQCSLSTFETIEGAREWLLNRP